ICHRYLVSKALLECCQLGQNTAVVNIAAHLDSDSSNQRRTKSECRVEPWAVPPPQTGLDRRLQVLWQRRRAFDVSRMLRTLESNQSHKVLKDGRTISATDSDDVLNDLADPILVQETIHAAKAEQFLGLAFRSFVAFHLSAQLGPQSLRRAAVDPLV